MDEYSTSLIYRLKNKVEEQNVSHDVAHDIAQETPEERMAKIKEKMRENPTVSRQEIADALRVSLKTIARDIEKMPNVKYVGSGDKGHWEVY